MPPPVLRLWQRCFPACMNEQTLSRLRTLWDTDFLPTAAAVRGTMTDLIPPQALTWEQILRVLPGTVSDIVVKTINGTAKDVLDYAEHAETGHKVIAIGGDKLARGLTLEGLPSAIFSAHPGCTTL